MYCTSAVMRGLRPARSPDRQAARGSHHRRRRAARHPTSPRSPAGARTRARRPRRTPESSLRIARTHYQTEKGLAVLCPGESREERVESREEVGFDRRFNQVTNGRPGSPTARPRSPIATPLRPIRPDHRPHPDLQPVRAPARAARVEPQSVLSGSPELIIKQGRVWRSSAQTLAGSGSLHRHQLPGCRHHPYPR